MGKVIEQLGQSVLSMLCNQSMAGNHGRVRLASSNLVQMIKRFQMDVLPQHVLLELVRQPSEKLIGGKFSGRDCEDVVQLFQSALLRVPFTVRIGYRRGAGD